MVTGESHPLLKSKSTSDKEKEDFIKEAMKSEAALNIDQVFKDQEKGMIETLKRETFEKVYDTMGTEIEAQNLARALVVRNEKFSCRMSFFLTIITLGLFLLFRPRDDDTVLVLTKDGSVVQVKVERTPCCPTNPNAATFVFLKYMAVLFGILVLPNMIYIIATGQSIEEELHSLNIRTKEDLLHVLKQHYPMVVFTLAVLLFWFCSLIPHDYRDRYHRRHIAREVAVGQFTMTGSCCRRRSSFRLFFGKYPSQLMLDLVGSLDLGRAMGTIPPGDLSATATFSASSLIMGLTLFLSFVTTVDTFFGWMDRSIALNHLGRMQLYCKEAPNDRGVCSKSNCEQWVLREHPDIQPKFCSHIRWMDDSLGCGKFGKQAPCCGGCTEGGLVTKEEGFMGNLKSYISLIADTGTILFTLLAAKFALSLATASDSIDVMIKRRSRKNFKSEIANYELTVPLALNFMQDIFSKARTASGASVGQHVDAKPQERASWCGVRNFEVDDQLASWEQFFEDDRLSPPDTRWTAKCKVPRKCLGISEEEEVLGAWIELPLLPPPISFFEFMTGGLWYALLPFGKTRHAVIITDQRIFYVRQRRPALPLRFLGTDLRIDAFRHDHDVIYGRMDRTKLSFANRIVHQKLLFENFIPGRILMQTRFGAIEINRFHGDGLDVYHLISQLSRNTPGFISRQDVESAGIIWESCQEDVRKSLKKEGSVWKIEPQPDDKVVPVPDCYLSSVAKEEMIFHLTLKDLGGVSSGTYTNTDVIVTNNRIFFWTRQAYKKFDCMSLACWCFLWKGFLNPIFSAKNLPNSMSFFTLPSLLSFSTDLSVDPASWCVPHHTPLKCPCVEQLCAALTRCITKSQGQAQGSWSLCPRRSGASAILQILWRLKQSSHADNDMVVLCRIKPHLLEEEPESDAEDVFNGLGFVTDKSENAGNVIKDHAMKVETLRKIMCVVQDACKKLNDKNELV